MCCQLYNLCVLYFVYRQAAFLLAHVPFQEAVFDGRPFKLSQVHRAMYTWLDRIVLSNLMRPLQPPAAM